MSKFKDAKKKARARRITEAQRKAAKGGKILEGFQCPQKRCMNIMKVPEFREAPEDHSCHRCGSNVETFTPLFTDLRKITPKDILKYDH